MARTTPRKYFEFFILPNYYDYLSSPSDVRLGFNACVSTFQQADIFYHFYKRHDPSRISLWPSKRSLLIDLSKRNPHFLTIQSVATVYKHLYAAGGIYEVSSPMAVGGVVYSSTKIKSQWGGRSDEGDVVVSRRGKPHVSLRKALQDVIVKMWPDILGEEDL